MKICAMMLLVGGTWAGLAAQTAKGQEPWPEAQAARRLGQLGGTHLIRNIETHRVTRVALVNVGPTNAALSLAAQLPAVRELEVVALPWQDFNDVGLAYVARMTQLTQLQLVGPNISNYGVAQLAGLSSVEQLAIDAPISDGALDSIGKMRRLRLLDLHGAQVTGPGLSRLAGLDQLEFLVLDQTPVGDAGMPFVGQLGGLRRLLLRDTRISDAGLEHLVHLANLEQLYLDGSLIRGAGLSGLAGAVDPPMMTFAGAAQLREVSLRRAANLGSEHLSALANLYGLPYFTKLDIAQTPVSQDAAALDRLARAEQIAEHWRQVQGIGSSGPILRFDDNLNLVGLYFIPPGFTASNGALDELFNYPPTTLRELSLRDAILRNVDVQSLTKLTNLQRLNLYKTRIGDEGLKHLQGLANLRQLFLDEGNNLITEGGIDALKTAIPEIEVVRLP